jgi:hypothetical protein
MRRGDAFVRFMAWVYTAGFAFVVIALDLSVFSAPWQAPDFGMTNIAVNLTQIVIVAVAIVVLVRAWRSVASVASPASI